MQICISEIVYFLNVYVVKQMWRTPVNERREKILTALTSSRKRFKCGREMKKRATIWGLRLRRPPPPPMQLSALEQVISYASK